MKQYIPAFLSKGSLTYLRATASSLDKVKRSVLLLGNMAAKMSVNRPEERNMSEHNGI